MSVKSYALTTRARLMEFIGLTSVTSAQGNVLDNIINQVTEWIEKYCGGIRFMKTTYTKEEYSADGGSDQLILRHYPVVSTSPVSLMYRNTAENKDNWTSYDSEDFFIDYDSGILTLTEGAKFLQGNNQYAVTYTAGYDFNNSATFLSDTRAGDVELACWVLAKTAYLRRKSEGGISSERIGDYSVTYAKTLFENEDIKAILDGYKKIDNVGLPTGNLTP